MLKFILNTGFYGVAEIFGRLLQAGAMIWLAGVCEKEDYARIGLLFALQQMVTFLSLGGLGEAVTGKINEFRGDGMKQLIAGAYRVFMIVASCIGLLFFLSSVTFLPGIVGGGNPYFLAVILLAGLILAWFRLGSLLLQLQEKHKATILFRTVPIVVGYLSGICFAYFSPESRVNSFFLGCTSGFFFCFLISYPIMGRPLKGFKCQPGLNKELFVAAVPFAFVAIFGWFSGYGNNIVLNGLFGSDEVAEYTFVANFNFIILMVINSVSQVWSPRFFIIAERNQGERLNDLNALVSQGQLVVMSLVSGLILLFFRDVVALLGGKISAYENIHPYLMVIFISYAVLSLYYRSLPFYLLHKKGKYFMTIMLWASFVGSMLWLLLMWAFGTWGIYIGFLFLMMLRGVAIFIKGRKLWGIKMSWADLPLAISIICGAYYLSVTIEGLFLRSILFLMVVIIVLCCFLRINRSELSYYMPVLMNKKFAN